jgi:hypothetical protein
MDIGLNEHGVHTSGDVSRILLHAWNFSSEHVKFPAFTCHLKAFLRAAIAVSDSFGGYVSQAHPGRFKT